MKSRRRKKLCGANFFLGQNLFMVRFCAKLSDFPHFLLDKERSGKINLIKFAMRDNISAKDLGFLKFVFNKIGSILKFNCSGDNFDLKLQEIFH